MIYKRKTNFLQYLMLALILVFPGLTVDAQTANVSGTDKDITGKTLPPIDQNPPKVFETAAFGLG
jgi:hypothetical protein